MINPNAILSPPALASRPAWAREWRGSAKAPALVHYCAAPLAEIRSTPQPESKSRGFKPHGLWVSVEGKDDWRAWCESESFGAERFRLEYEIVLRPDSRVLHIRGAQALDSFTRMFRAGDRDRFLDQILWGDVAAAWQGIVIAPYLWSRRNTDHTFWYYPWDCASGCIWDASAVAKIIPRTGKPSGQEPPAGGSPQAE